VVCRPRALVGEMTQKQNNREKMNVMKLM